MGLDAVIVHPRIGETHPATDVEFGLARGICIDETQLSIPLELGQLAGKHTAPVGHLSLDAAHHRQSQPQSDDACEQGDQKPDHDSPSSSRSRASSASSSGSSPAERRRDWARI